MDRRTFSRNLLGVAAGAATLGQMPAFAQQSSGGSNDANESGVPFGFSVMLWTVFKNMPFEQRLQNIKDAGYKNVELVGEYHKWSDEEFNRNNAKRKELGINFDITAGLRHGVGNPNDREAMLADVRKELPIMEKLDCPAVIVMSGNVVPGMTRDVQHKSCIDGLKQIATLIDGKKINGQPIRALIENIDQEENPKYFMQSVAEGFDIVRAVDHPQIQLLYDFYHEQIAEGNLIEKLEKNIQYVGLVHIADVPGRHEPGTGEINYYNIFKKLAELKYNRMAAMEFYPTSDPVGKLRHAREMAIKAARA